MPQTPNLDIDHIETLQSQKEVTANEAFDVLDENIAGMLIHNMASDANYTLVITEPDLEHDKYVIKITDTGVVLTTQRDIIFPNEQRVRTFWNDTAQSLRFKTSAGAAIIIAAGNIRIILIDDQQDAIELGGPGAAGAIAFVQLTDVDQDYSGDALKILRVNGGETGIEFVPESAAQGVNWAVPFKGGRSGLSANLTAQDYSILAAIAWTEEEEDTDTFVDIGGNATRLTVPGSGVSRVKVSANIHFDLVTANQYIVVQIRKGGSDVYEGRGRVSQQHGADDPSLYVETANITVSPTDYFELFVLTETDTSITILDNSWFQIEVVQTDDATNPPFDAGGFVGDLPTDLLEVLRLPAVRDYSFPVAMAGSAGDAGTASTGDVEFSLQKNDVEFGTMRFNISGTATFTAVSQTDFDSAVPDVLTIIAPATADFTLADIGYNLKGNLSG